MVEARDERGAAWMAAGWAFATGQAGVVIVSGTAGLTGAATALADASTSGIPLLCITAGASAATNPGVLDLAAIARPISVWTGCARSADEAGALTARALRRARSRRPGAAVLDLPVDVQQSTTKAAPETPLALQDPEPEPSVITDARALLQNARRPVILADGGCYWDGAGDVLRAFAEATRLPVFTMRAARGLISDEHELCFGSPNPRTAPARIARGEADVALVIGADVDVSMAGDAFRPDCAVIRIDARTTLSALAADATALPTHAWIERLGAERDRRASAVAERARIASAPLHPGRLLAEVVAKLPPDAMVCVDGEALALWAADALPARLPGSLHMASASPLGARGSALPRAIGMKLAHPGRPALVLTDDRAFGYTVTELQTSARHHAPVAVIVGNVGRSPYEVLAEFAGGVGDAVQTPQQLAIAVTNALVAPVPSVINAQIDASARHEADRPIAPAFTRARDSGRL